MTVVRNALRPAAAVGAAAAVQRAAQIAMRRMAQGTSGPVVSYQGGTGPITIQRDYVPSEFRRSKFRNKAAIRRSKFRARRIRRKFRRIKRKFARKVKRVFQHHFQYNVFFSWGRSWKSLANTQRSCLLPIFSWRGQVTPSGSDALNATPNTDQRVGRCDMASSIKQLVDNEVFYPTGAAANTSQQNWWYKVNRAVLDLTISNTGSSGEATPSATNNKMEFEV